MVETVRTSSLQKLGGWRGVGAPRGAVIRFGRCLVFASCSNAICHGTYSPSTGTTSRIRQNYIFREPRRRIHLTNEKRMQSLILNLCSFLCFYLWHKRVGSFSTISVDDSIQVPEFMLRGFTTNCSKITLTATQNQFSFTTFEQLKIHSGFSFIIQFFCQFKRLDVILHKNAVVYSQTPTLEGLK